MTDYCNVIEESQREINLSCQDNLSLKVLSQHILSMSKSLQYFKQNTFELEIPSVKDLTKFSAAQKDFSSKLKTTIGLLEEQLLVPLVDLSNSVETISNENINEFRKISDDLISSKQHLKKFQMNYYRSCKSTREIEKKISEKLLQKNFILNNNRIAEDHDNLMKFKAKNENDAQLYKYEIIKMNKTIAENNKKYLKLKQKIRARNESKSAFMKDSLMKYTKFLRKFHENFGNFLASLEETSKEIQVSIKEEPNEVRFPLENFVEFDPNNFNEEDEGSQEKGFSSEFEILGDEEISQAIESLKETDLETEYERKIKDFQNILLSKDEMPSGKIPEIISFLSINNSINNSLLFVKWFVDYFISTGTLIKFKNEINLNHFTNIINTVSNSINTATESQEIIPELNKSIIVLAQKTFHENTFMSYLLAAKNKFYQTKTFWTELIMKDIRVSLENYISEKILKAKIPFSEKIKEKDKNQFFKNLFKKDKNEVSNLAQPHVTLVEKMNLALNKYEKLRDKQKLAVDEFLKKEIERLMKEFIPYMCSFNFPIKVAHEMIAEFCGKFELEDKFDYFLSILDVECLTKKRKITSPPKITTKIAIRKYYHPRNNKFVILKNVAKFLEKKELSNLLLLNRDVHEKLKKKFIKHHLPATYKTASLEKVIAIWKLLLKFKEIKKQINYATIQKKIPSISKKVSESIELDIKRTSFLVDEKKNQEKTRKILRCIAVEFPLLGYCQGMNYVVAFLLQLFSFDEEEVFYFYYSIIKNTEYSCLYDEDLKELKLYFNVIDKIIQLFLPSFYSVLERAKIKSNYFTPGWFLTLFTSTCTLFERQKVPKSILLIWTKFILEGYRGILEVVIGLINICSNAVLLSREEDLFGYTIKKLTSEDIFTDEQFEHFESQMSKVVIDKILLEEAKKY